MNEISPRIRILGLLVLLGAVWSGPSLVQAVTKFITSQAETDVAVAIATDGGPVGAGVSLAFAKADHAHHLDLATSGQNGLLTTADHSYFSGKVDSVGATAPVVSSGGDSPTISMPVANGTTDGYLDKDDWTTFNAKQALLGFQDNESPTGTIDGVNATFYLTRIPSPAASLKLFLNGVEQASTTNYTTMDNVVTFGATDIPASPDELRAFYRYDPTTWTPSMLGAALVLWLRADSGVTLNGSTVSAWASKVGTYSAIQGTAGAQPTFVASSASLNNKAALSFDGYDYLTTTLFPSAITTVAVVVVDSRLANQCSIGATNGTNRSILYTGEVENKIAAGVGAQNQATIKGTTVLGATPRLAILDYNGSTVNLWLGTSNEYTAAQSGVGAQATYPYMVGTVNNSGSALYNMTGLLAEVIVVQGRVLTTAEYEHLAAYARDQYGTVP